MPHDVLAPHLHIVCHSFYDTTGTTRAIGGVETYVGCLADLAFRRGWVANIWQFGEVHIDREIGPGIRLVFWNNENALHSMLEQRQCEVPGIVIYSDFSVAHPPLTHPCILLQHGVGWDNWYYESLRAGRLKGGNVVRRISRLLFLRRVRAVTSAADDVVCVDTNFINVMRAMYPRDNWSEHLWYIPNFAELPNRAEVKAKWEVGTGRLRCIFPRRFAPLRGAVLFSEVVRELAEEFRDVTFAFVGSGVCEPEMRHILAARANVELYEKPYNEMMREYVKADIAVIPTVAAEGTSLSCIEAMAAGCAVVATNVGGLCNLVIPEFTGLLCQPTKTELRAAVIRLLNDADLRRRLAETARLAAETTFTRDLWESRIWGIIHNTSSRSRILAQTHGRSRSTSVLSCDGRDR